MRRTGCACCHERTRWGQTSLLSVLLGILQRIPVLYSVLGIRIRRIGDNTGFGTDEPEASNKGPVMLYPGYSWNPLHSLFFVIHPGLQVTTGSSVVSNHSWHHHSDPALPLTIVLFSLTHHKERVQRQRSPGPRSLI